MSARWAALPRCLVASRWTQAAPRRVGKVNVSAWQPPRRLSSASNAAVTLTMHEQTAVIKFTNPGQRNAMTVEVGERFAALVQEVTDMSKDTKVTGLVVTGSGTAFSAGGDLGFLLDRASSSPRENVEEMRKFYARFLSIRKVPVPTIAAVNGSAIGAGLCLALACDIRVAAANAKMGLSFSALGLHPGMGATHFLPKLIGAERASRMLLLGTLLEGEVAQRVGLISEVVPVTHGEAAEQVNERTLAAALRIGMDLATRSPTAIRSIVTTLRHQQDVGLDAALQREADAQAMCYATPEYRACIEAVRARTSRA